MCLLDPAGIHLETQTISQNVVIKVLNCVKLNERTKAVIQFYRNVCVCVCFLGVGGWWGGVGGGWGGGGGGGLVVIFLKALIIF